MNEYLIPANSKKSKLILGFLTGLDLGIFLTGLIITLLMLVVFKGTNLFMMILIVLPLAISAFLVMPVPHYHNILQLIINVINFITGRRRFYWKGWSIKDEINR